MTDTWRPSFTVDQLYKMAKEERDNALKNVKPGDHRSCSVCAYWDGYIRAIENIKAGIYY